MLDSYMSIQKIHMYMYCTYVYEFRQKNMHIHMHIECMTQVFRHLSVVIQAYCMSNCCVTMMLCEENQCGYINGCSN